MLRFLRENAFKFANVQRLGRSRRPDLRRTRFGWEELEDRVTPVTFTVTVPGDAVTSIAPVTPASGTLRFALQQASTTADPAGNVIIFKVPGNVDNVILAGHGQLNYQ